MVSAQANVKVFMRGVFVAMLTAVCLVASPAIAAEGTTAPAEAATPTAANPPLSTADHSKFKELEGPFTIGEVTKACLACHTEASKQIHRTIHWTWEYIDRRTAQTVGKRHVLNNLYQSIYSNYDACTSCHIGFGWVDEEFDFTSEEKVDCLVCHDTTGKYAFERFHQDGAKCSVCHDERRRADRSRERADLAELARRVGPTSRRTCGSCHFYDGGADGAKHGDLDSSLFAPDKNLDVHMDAQGLNFACATCHQADQHMVPGSRYSPTPADTRGIDVVNGGRATCQSCHGTAPMKDATLLHVDHTDKLNDHTDKIACQTCHIPAFARGGIATKMAWDWSTAGERGRRGTLVVRKDKENRVNYVTQKGDFRLATDEVPEYRWFNGDVTFARAGDKIDAAGVVDINTYHGGPGDKDSRIFPVKAARGKQAYDAGNRTLAVPHLSGRDGDAYWTGYKWDRALAAGMEAAGLPFSGEVGFVETRMLWPINHMVAPAKDALDCESCHTRNGRLAGIDGVYIPGQDRNGLLDLVGFVMIGMTAAGGLFHGLMRLVFRRSQRKLP